MRRSIIDQIDEDDPRPRIGVGEAVWNTAAAYTLGKENGEFLRALIGYVGERYPDSQKWIMENTEGVTFGEAEARALWIILHVAVNAKEFSEEDSMAFRLDNCRLPFAAGFCMASNIKMFNKSASLFAFAAGVLGAIILGFDIISRDSKQQGDKNVG